jgi:TRAP-type C4-dicarboxylate transport system permease small subunit
VVSTLRRQSTAWLRCKLVICAVLAIGLVLVAGWSGIVMQSEWSEMESGKNMDRLTSFLGMLVLSPFCAIHAYRIQVALRRQKERRAIDLSGEATN